MYRRFLITLALLIFCTSVAHAQVAIKDGNSSTLAEVNSNGAVEVVQGSSSRATYIASTASQATTAAVTVSLEADSSLSIRVIQICVGGANATSAAAVSATVQRRTTASSGGTAFTAEGTSGSAVTKLDPADSNFAGVARLGGTPGTAGAVLDQWSWSIGEVGAGTADPPGMPVFCKDYSQAGTKPIIISAGTANGITVVLSSAGSGGLSSGSIGITFTTQ